MILMISYNVSPSINELVCGPLSSSKYDGHSVAGDTCWLSANHNDKKNPNIYGIIAVLCGQDTTVRMVSSYRLLRLGLHSVYRNTGKPLWEIFVVRIFRGIDTKFSWKAIPVGLLHFVFFFFVAVADSAESNKRKSTLCVNQ